MKRVDALPRAAKRRCSVTWKLTKVLCREIEADILYLGTLMKVDETREANEHTTKRLRQRSKQVDDC